MSDPVNSRQTEVPSVGTDRPDQSTIEAYKTDEATVLYDARNPLAWIESTRTVPIDDHV
ncbi:MAG: hypothetical protein SVG88_11260 [Halobacteriales archaeon]|nr:hypothetical protein [Halobacteriales archaeon]